MTALSQDASPLLLGVSQAFPPFWHVFIPGVGEVDFLIEECLVVETDGSTHYADVV